MAKPDSTPLGCFAGRRRWLVLAGHAVLALGVPCQAATRPVVANEVRLLVVGDSLSAEYGLARGTGWVALLAQRAKRPGLSVVNASVSGETTSGGRARLGALLAQHRPTHVVVELGANDALRGLAVASTQDNLRQMVREIRKAGAQPVLVGMMLPPNFGPAYAREFAQVYTHVAQSERVPLVPFMLAGVADRPDAREWFQPDGIHPLGKAHPVILETLWAVLGPLLKG